MRLDLKCQTDEFAGFCSGLYKAIIVEGKRKLWEYGTRVKIGDSVAVTNCISPAPITFEVSQVINYMGAATLETAIEDARCRLGSSAEGYEFLRIYTPPNGRDGFLPSLAEGIYAIMLKKNISEGEQIGNGSEHSDSNF